MFIYVGKKKAGTALETNKVPLRGRVVSCKDKHCGASSAGSGSQSGGQRPSPRPWRGALTAPGSPGPESFVAPK